MPENPVEQTLSPWNAIYSQKSGSSASSINAYEPGIGNLGKGVLVICASGGTRALLCKHFSIHKSVTISGSMTKSSMDGISERGKLCGTRMYVACPFIGTSLARALKDETIRASRESR